MYFAINPIFIIFLLVAIITFIIIAKKSKSNSIWIIPALLAVILITPFLLRFMGMELSAPAMPGVTVRSKTWVLMLPILAILIIIILLWHGSKTGRWIAGVIIAVLLLMGSLFFFSVRTVETTHETISHYANMPYADDLNKIIQGQSPLQTKPSPIWLEGIEQQFVADVYPSQAAAGRALGQQTVTLLPTLTGDQQMPTIVQISGQADAHKLTAETLHAIADGIRSDNTIQQVLVETVPIDSGQGIYINNPQAIGIEVSLPKFGHTSSAFQKSNHTAVTSGTISLSLRNQEHMIQRTANFVEKSWAQNFAAFINQDHRPWRIARSQSSCTDENDAQQQAIADACRQVTSIVQQWFQEQKMLLADINFNPIDLEQAGIIADRFTQSFEGGAGRIWRQALLLDFSPEKLMPLIEKYHQSLTVKKQTWLRTAISLLGLLVLICLVYLFLNMATRGYYTWALRMAMLILLAFGVTVILFLT